ncbi:MULTISPECIES: putative bifunctional diguanylate cyclase/phosphodiesterase [unclassified Pantoea]|uniref:putative bifunctional diguanylate cyclase/phosphodiesterase n=1 Tax=unclassified Pantoea TaxID=2630326 RepID=UPI001CD5A115|nr:MULTISPECIES: EAL domain-containing protein [unclassified Pantoea]MCA1176308.1 EAL domain-containing protein [Pantoea sp. alder69]MCA1249278.1 EAL domain-containing protein [Pantoea sp. alder70]MCA1264647.1 EAL domain-containing protein [Pantoea sp. alder81]
MINTIKLSDGFRRNFVREVILPLMAILILTFAGAGVGLFWGTSLSNEQARDQQQRMIEASFTQSLNEHLRQLRSLTRWSPLADQLALGVPDQSWLDQNIGGWLFDMFDHQLILLLDRNNQPLAVWRNGQRVAGNSPDRYVQDMLNSSLVKSSDEVAGPTDRADFVRIGQRAAALAVGDISSTRQAGRYRLVSIKFLDDGYLRNLADRSQLRQLHFSDGAPEKGKDALYQLKSQQEDAVGYLSWQPDKPGAQMLRMLGPSTLISVLLITLLCLFMVRRIWTSSLNLSQSLLKLGASEAQAQHLAFHDVLTGLPNRALVEERLSQALAVSARHDERVALLLLDLDRFKNINDTYGHHAGDELIIEVARRLTQILRHTDTVGRIGGDEFIIVMPEVDNIGQVQALAKRIISELSEPYELQGNEVWVGVSVGLALAPKDGIDRLELMRKADIALYEAKNGGRGQYRQFEKVMDESLRTHQQMATDLRQALVNFDGLRVWYQPLMEISGQRVVGLEALLRWHHPVRGDVSPGDFIAIAEETGMIIPLGEWVLREACKTSLKLPQVIVAVNVSPVQFRASGFVDRIIEIVREEGANPLHMELEITEGVLIEDEHEARNNIIALREAGFRIALDDFGTGYSSLNYLSTFPVDKIKIDRSFTQSLGVAQNSTAIVESVVRLGHAMGLTVTAEGVETEGQKMALADAGCNQLQGYLFSQAVPFEEIEKMM